MNIILSLFLFLSGHQAGANTFKDDVQSVINKAINSSELTAFTSHYTSRGDEIYFYFASSTAYNNQELRELRPIVLTIKNSVPLLYDESQNKKRKPVVTIQILKMTKDSAEVRIGIPIEGAVGKFTLIKKDAWIITESDVYEI